VGEARRLAMSAAQSLGFDENRRSDVGIVATEAATNVLLHARGGEFLVCPFRMGDTTYLDLLALDQGSGIRDVPRALQDGYSTSGTAGHGMGAIQRLSDESRLYSFPDRGTVFWSRFQDSTRIKSRPFGAVNIPMKGETICGDAFLVLPGASKSLYMMADGLGHGAHAAEAANEAVSSVRLHADRTASEIVTFAHAELKKTRGAAITVAIVDHERQTLTCSGVGNISSVILNGMSSRNMITQNGTLGVVLPRMQEYCYPIESRSVLLMYSDGINSKCSLSGYSGLQNRHPMLIAGLLYRDFSRHRDDATVLLASLGDEMS